MHPSHHSSMDNCLACPKLSGETVSFLPENNDSLINLAAYECPNDKLVPPSRHSQGKQFHGFSRKIDVQKVKLIFFSEFLCPTGDSCLKLHPCSRVVNQVQQLFFILFHTLLEYLSQDIYNRRKLSHHRVISKAMQFHRIGISIYNQQVKLISLLKMYMSKW